MCRSGKWHVTFILRRNSFSRATFRIKVRGAAETSEKGARAWHALLLSATCGRAQVAQLLMVPTQMSVHSDDYDYNITDWTVK